MPKTQVIIPVEVVLIFGPAAEEENLLAMRSQGELAMVDKGHERGKASAGSNHDDISGFEL